MTQMIPVLVVEDHPMILLTIEQALADNGFAVTTAASGEDAMAILEAQGLQFSALVTDVILGGNLTGWDLARHARQRNADMAIIYTTGTDGDQWAANGVPRSLLIQKPFATAQIVTGIAQLLNAAGSLD